METKFKIDQKVVYPSQGVGKVIDIFEKKFKDELLLYYKIYIHIFLPLFPFISFGRFVNRPYELLGLFS